MLTKWWWSVWFPLFVWEWIGRFCKDWS